MGKEPDDLESLEKAANDASGKASGLWLSFITFATLILITTGTVTHRKLFLEEALKLPVLNVDLPLISYFLFTPLFFVVYHFYLMLQLDGLATKVRGYDEELRRQQPVAAMRHLIRQRIDTFVLTQMLVGLRERREGLTGYLNRLVCWITLIGLPLLTLLVILIVFLPYHGEAITWWHRLALFVDTALIIYFWRRIARPQYDIRSALTGLWWRRPIARNLANAYTRTLVGETYRENADAKQARFRAWRAFLQSTRRGIPLAASMFIFSTFVAAYPTETIYALRIEPLTRVLFQQGFKFNPNTGEKEIPKTNYNFFSNRLQLRNENFNVAALLAKLKTEETATPKTDERNRLIEWIPPRRSTLHLSRRDLSFAQLDQVDLREADLSATSLLGAALSGANLEGANLSCDNIIMDPNSIRDCTDLRLANLVAINFHKARLDGANLSQANLYSANMKNATLAGTNLQGAILHKTDLRNSRAKNANLENTHVRETNLSDADLASANMVSAHFWKVDLRGASMKMATAHGAVFDSSRLEAASFEGANIVGGRFKKSKMAGVNFTYANLQGANLEVDQGVSLECAQLQASTIGGLRVKEINFTNATFFRTQCRTETCLGRLSSKATTSLEKSTNPCNAKKSNAQRSTYLQSAMRKIRDDETLEYVKSRLKLLDHRPAMPHFDNMDRLRWLLFRNNSDSPGKRATIMGNLACSDTSPDSSVARGLITNGNISALGSHTDALATRLLRQKLNKDNSCLGVYNFTDLDWARLELNLPRIYDE